MRFLCIVAAHCGPRDSIPVQEPRRQGAALAKNVCGMGAADFEYHARVQLKKTPAMSLYSPYALSLKSMNAYLPPASLFTRPHSLAEDPGSALHGLQPTINYLKVSY